MDKSIDKLESEIWQHFNELYDIKLTDSPQILKDYLYIEFWLDRAERKLRIPYPIDKRDFLRMPASERINWTEKAVFKELVTLLQKYD